jgi:hypothetical protein
MRTHGRTRLLIGVLSLAFAALPASAMAAHDLGIYKTEKQVDMESDDLTVTLSCNPGDYALDGMWRIDHADYDEDDNYITFLGRAVDVEWAYPVDTAIDADTKLESYTFKFNKNAIGRAQLKVFATCIKGRTEQANSHDHVINVSVKTPVVDPDGTFDTSASPDRCGGNEFVAQTGYEIIRSTPANDIDPYVGHLSESWPTDARTWSWVMDLSQDVTNPVTVRYYWSCVSRKVPLNAGEKHKLVYRLQGPESHSIPATKIKTKRIECKSHYKAVVAGFSFTPPVGYMDDPNPELIGDWDNNPMTLDAPLQVPHMWFLGMDPQPKNRDFKFLNSHSSAHPADIKAICLNYRTT